MTPLTNGLSELHHDMWSQIAAKVRFSDRTQFALTCKTAAQAVRDTWSEMHYFEAAGRPEKPTHLRIPHRLPYPHEARPWLARTRELKESSVQPQGYNSLVTERPSVVLMALAKKASPESIWDEVADWPQYQRALAQTRRGSEAKRFEELEANKVALRTALSDGNDAAFARLLEAGAPLPRDVEFLNTTLLAHPHLAERVLAALIAAKQGPFAGALYAAADSTGRQAILTTAVFQESLALRRALRDAATNWQPWSESMTALLDLVHASNQEQLGELFGRDQAGALGIDVLYPVAWDDRMKEAFKDLLEAWLQAGGEATTALWRVPNSSPASVELLVRYGGCPTTALRNLMEQDFSAKDFVFNEHAYLSTTSVVDALLTSGARLTCEEFQAFVQRNKDFENWDTQSLVWSVGERFARHGAVPVSSDDNTLRQRISNALLGSQSKARSQNPFCLSPNPYIPQSSPMQIRAFCRQAPPIAWLAWWR